MKKILVLSALLYAAPSLAVISGPTTSTSGQFSLSWESGLTLREVSSTGAILNTWTGSSTSLSKPVSGTYYFQEIWCGHIPFSGYMCYSIDTHNVTVNIGPSGASYPESLTDQAGYEYRLRSGDFDNNGRTDVLVERISAGPVGGSMQSYIVWNNSNDTISTASLSGSPYATNALNASLDGTLNLLQTSINADGYVDHILERVDQVLGSQFQQELAVYAPGTEANKLQPSGSHQIDGPFKSFTLDLARWMNDETYFATNIMTTTIPIFAVGFECVGGYWSSVIFAFSDGQFCFPYGYVVGYQTVQFGINFSALSASTYMDNIPAGGGEPSLSDLWQISQIARSMIGVHLFGFDEQGNRRPTNHDGGELDQRTDAFWEFAYFAISMAQDEVDTYPEHEHDYTTNTEICQTTQAWCTLANIACWGRHYHAPGKKEGYEQAASNGDVTVLVGPLGRDNPVRVGVGSAAGLPPNAIGNITMDGHWFHNPEMGGWGTCPQTVPEQGAGEPPAACNQVYREPHLSGGKIRMRTRGTGENNLDWVNQRQGPGTFEDLDELMKEAILNEPTRLCPSL